MGTGNLGRIGKTKTLSDVHKDGGIHDNHDRYQQALQDTTNSYHSGRRDITNFFQEIHGRPIDSEDYMEMALGNLSRHKDYTGPWDVSEIFFDISNSSTGTDSNGDPEYIYKLYIRHKATIGQFPDDTPIAGLQILDDSGTVVFTLKPDSVGENASPNHLWETMRTETTSFSINRPLGAASETYHPLEAQSNYGSATADRFWCRGHIGTIAAASNITQTVSSYTGAQGGISDDFLSGANSTPMPVGYSTIQQTRNSRNFFRECSGAAHNASVCLRTASTYAFPEKGSIRIAYAFTTRTSAIDDLDQDDTLFLGLHTS
jgi:hypothetical protein